MSGHVGAQGVFGTYGVPYVVTIEYLVRERRLVNSASLAPFTGRGEGEGEGEGGGEGKGKVSVFLSAAG